MCRDWWMPWGDFRKEAVVWDASPGKPVMRETRRARRERGRRVVMKLAIREMRRAKLEFLRKGCVRLA